MFKFQAKLLKSKGKTSGIFTPLPPIGERPVPPYPGDWIMRLHDNAYEWIPKEEETARLLKEYNENRNRVERMKAESFPYDIRGSKVVSRVHLDFDKLYGKAFKITDNAGNPELEGFSIVTPENGASWTSWKEKPQFKVLVKKRLNDPDFLGDHKYDQIVRSAAKLGIKTAKSPFKTKEFEGFTILIGRSAADNDTLSLEIAQPNDFWLHTADFPGSHVVIRNPDSLQELPPEVLQEAARAAVENSRAKGQQGVPVVIGRAGDLSKPVGSAVGEIEISQFKTVRA